MMHSYLLVFLPNASAHAYPVLLSPDGYKIPTSTHILHAVTTILKLPNHQRITQEPPSLFVALVLTFFVRGGGGCS